MSRIRSADTKPELIVRSLLHRCGFRFSLRRKDLPGKPDIVMPKYQTAIFVHGCFWHRHPGCPQATTPSTRLPFWLEKFRRNTERDARNTLALENSGWRVITLWECEILRDPAAVVESVVAIIDPDRLPACRYDELPDRKDTLRLAEAKLRYRLGDDRPT